MGVIMHFISLFHFWLLLNFCRVQEPQVSILLPRLCSFPRALPSRDKCGHPSWEQCKLEKEELNTGYHHDWD